MSSTRLQVALLAALSVSAPHAAADAAEDPTHGAAAVDSTARSRAPGSGAGAAPARGFALLRPWSWGWRAGAGGTGFTGALADSSAGSIVGYDAGVFATLDAGWLSLEPQAIFAVRGARFTDPWFGTVIDEFGDPYVVKVGEIEGTLTAFELRAPVLARVRIAPWGFEPHLLAGLVPAVLVHGSYSGNRILRDFWPETLRRTNLGWAAGAGTRWRTRHGALTIDFRYEEGGGDLFKAGRGLPGRARAWVLGVGLRMERREPRPAG